MNLKELHDAASRMLAAGVDPRLPVGNSDHFGDLETEVVGLVEKRSSIPLEISKGTSVKAFIHLQGMPSGYPEPD